MTSALQDSSGRTKHEWQICDILYSQLRVALNSSFQHSSDGERHFPVDGCLDAALADGPNVEFDWNSFVPRVNGRQIHRSRVQSGVVISLLLFHAAQVKRKVILGGRAICHLHRARSAGIQASKERLVQTSRDG